ncbi:Monoacylglycerol lipase abhd12 [Perkinsus olseni]|uniref:Monoacylglycerol lipase abhd12 n=2 Tax=Perkinsus olseni TaxID=32597 RepID=A0A7J6T0T9_PEROL|nr:Monoacylglycerol lipase abhd12 [Perkinsus olseni]
MRSILPRPFIALTALLAALLSLILYDFNYIVVSLIHLDFAHVPSSISPLTDPAVTAGLQGARNYRVQSGNESLGVWLIPANNATKPAERAVIYFHGQAGSRGQGHRIELYKMLADRLNATVVAFDLRGYGDSTGTPWTSGVLEDIRTIVDWTGKMLGNNTLPVYMYGHSLGGPQALYAARYMVKTRRRVSGCILESTFVEFPRTAAQHPMTLPLWFLPLDTRTRLLDSLMGPAMEDPTRFDYYTGRQLRLLRLEAPGMPVINFHGLSDWQISPENARALKESVGGVDYTTVFIDGGGHSDLHTGDHQDRMVRALRDWFPQTANRSSTVY